MASRKEAIVFIPSFYSKSSGYVLDNFLALGLTSRLEGREVNLDPDDIKIAGQSGKRFMVESLAGDPKTIDVYETYWTDLVDKLSEKNAKEQIFRGLFLFIYWLSSRIWVMARQSRALLVQFLVTLFLVVLWYYGSVAVALVAIGQNPSAFGLELLPPDWAQVLVRVGKHLGGWPVWAIASVLLGLLPISVTALVDYTDFITRYLQDDTDVELGPIRDRIRQRVTSVLHDVLQDEQENYERVTVLAHSFGVMIGIDLLADYRVKTAKPLRFISMGGSIELLSYKSQWILDESVKCLNNPAVESWYDYYSDQDWLCTKTPIPHAEQPQKFQNRRIQLRVPLPKQLLGDSHSAYFFERSLLEHLLDW